MGGGTTVLLQVSAPPCLLHSSLADLLASYKATGSVIGCDEEAQQ